MQGGLIPPGQTSAGGLKELNIRRILHIVLPVRVCWVNLTFQYKGLWNLVRNNFLFWKEKKRLLVCFQATTYLWGGGGGRGWFTKTKIDFKLDLTMAGCSCHCLFSPFTGIGLSRDLQIKVKNLQNLHFSLLKEKRSSWWEQPLA